MYSLKIIFSSLLSILFVFLFQTTNCLIDEDQFILNRAWDKLEKEFLLQYHLEKKQISLKRFSTSYKQPEAIFIFSSKNKLNDYVRIFRGYMNLENNTISISDISKANTISFHESVYNILQKEVSNFCFQNKLQINYIDTITQYEDSFDFYKLYLVNTKMKNYEGYYQLYIAINNYNIPNIYKVVHKKEELSLLM